MKIDRNKIVKVIDFWHSSIDRYPLLKRDIFEKINLKSKEIKDILGPRRSGKSSILKLIIKSLKKNDGFLYINFEDPFFIENNTVEVIEELIDVYKEYYNENLKFLFFDEIQEINGWERVVRKLRDGTNYNIFLTGSSSTLLSQELSSSITGRHISSKVYPLSFSEFLNFENLELTSHKDLILKEKKIQKKFDQFLDIGGFPEVVLSENKELLKDYFYDFLQKDIINRYDIRDKDALEKMAVYLMTNTTKITSIASLKKTFNLSFEAASNYLRYMQEAFLFFELKQFSYSLKKQSKALSKIYSVDSGLAQAVSFAFSQNKGRLLENIIFLHLLRSYSDIYYFKSADGLEVDFLVREKRKNRKLIQVSWSLNEAETKKREFRALLKGMEELKMKEGFVVTYNEEGEEIFNGKKIEIIPAWKFLLGNDFEDKKKP